MLRIWVLYFILTYPCRHTLHLSARQQITSFIRKYLTPDALKTAVHALISSKVDYCNSLPVGLPTTQIGRLQNIMNSCHVLPIRSSMARLLLTFLTSPRATLHHDHSGLPITVYFVSLRCTQRDLGREFSPTLPNHIIMPYRLTLDSPNR